MELSAAYKSIGSKIKSFEQQLSACDTIIEQCKQSGI